MTLYKRKDILLTIKENSTISWGGNRDYFTDSDITLKEKTTILLLINATAHDKPKDGILITLIQLE